MNKKIEKDNVLAMLNEGFSRSEIAKRLKASERQIRRIAKRLENELNRKFKADPNLKDANIELCRRNIYKKAGKPLSEIGKSFGISKQAVHKGR